MVCDVGVCCCWPRLAPRSFSPAVRACEERDTSTRRYPPTTHTRTHPCAFARPARAIGCMQKKVSPHDALVRPSPPVEELSVTHQRSTAAILPVFDSPPTNPDDAPWTLTSRRPAAPPGAGVPMHPQPRAPSPGPESIAERQGSQTQIFPCPRRSHHIEYTQTYSVRPKRPGPCETFRRTFISDAIPPRRAGSGSATL